MFPRKLIILCCCALFVRTGFAQIPADTILPVDDRSLAIDTSLDYDTLLDEFGDFLDSLLAPRNYFLVNVSAANGYFNYKSNTGSSTLSKKELVISPALGYYHKSGPGIAVSGSIGNYGNQYHLYQYAVTPSFDFIQNRKWIAGVAYTRYSTMDSLPFYTTPLQNEVNVYFLWRKSWLQPGITANYGWGSRHEVQKRESYFPLLRRLTGIVSTTGTDEKIADLSVTASLRHTFYWLHLSRRNDYIKLTPMLTFSSGTQQYGFNQVTGTYLVNVRNSGSVQYNTGHVNLNDELEFQPLALTLYVRPEYQVGTFFIQPQFILDYYFPARDKRLTSLFSVNAGLMF